MDWYEKWKKMTEITHVPIVVGQFSKFWMRPDHTSIYRDGFWVSCASEKDTIEECAEDLFNTLTSLSNDEHIVVTRYGDEKYFRWDGNKFAKITPTVYGQESYK